MTAFTLGQVDTHGGSAFVSVFTCLGVCAHATAFTLTLPSSMGDG